MRGLSFLFMAVRFVYGQTSSCNTLRSNHGSYLKGHVYKASSVTCLKQCMMSCTIDHVCQSCNFYFGNKTCEFNDADHFDHPYDLVTNEGVTYIRWQIKKDKLFKSCAEIKEANPKSSSGYYGINLLGNVRHVYCDMEKYGGGWTLVVSINASNNNHLQAGEINCKMSNLCVNYNTSTVASRKLSDQSIIALAAKEGVFRVDLLRAAAITNFYKFPKGAPNFSSMCHSSTCARIIVSHHYPYQWESNCKGIQEGFAIMHRVFDCHDNYECNGVKFLSSLYSTNRILYGYTVGGHTGLFAEKAGHLFVK